MSSNHLVAIIVCATTGIATIAQPEPAFAKKKNKNEETNRVVNNGVANGSCLNGRPWQAMAADFDEVLYRPYNIKKDTESILVGNDAPGLNTIGPINLHYPSVPGVLDQIRGIRCTIRTGRSKANVVPRPSVLSARILRPCNSTMRLAMERYHNLSLMVSAVVFRKKCR
jgi:hypothetical protein